MDKENHLHKCLVVVANFLNMNIIFSINVGLSSAVWWCQCRKWWEIKKILHIFSPSFSNTTMRMSKFHYSWIFWGCYLKKKEHIFFFFVFKWNEEYWINTDMFIFNTEFYIKLPFPDELGNMSDQLVENFLFPDDDKFPIDAQIPRAYPKWKLLLCFFFFNIL